MSPTALTDFFKALRPRLAGELRTDLYSRVLYSTDASNYRVMPYGVLIPQTVDDIQAAMELAAQYRLPVLPRAAGTSLAGQAVNEALIIDLSRHLDKVLEINAEEHWVRVQPGLVLDDLNQQLKPLGLQFGPDPASSSRAAMGGIVANNASGSHSIVYGMAADHVLETGVILSDGCRAAFGRLTPDELRQRQQLTGLEGDLYRRVAAIVQNQAPVIRAGTPRHWRRCGGYNLDRLVSGTTFYNQPEARLDQPPPPFNLTQLICGSEGTLAIITDLKLNLVPRPRHTALALVHFEGLYPALATVPTILETGPAAVELLDNLSLTMCRQQPEYARLLHTYIQGHPHCLLMVEYTGDSQAELTAKIDRLAARVGAGRASARPAPAITPLLSPQLQQNVWTVRKVGLGLLMSLRSDTKPIPFIEDAAVPVEHLADYVGQIERFCRDLGTDITLYAHASAGCLHIRPLVNLKLADEAAKLPRIAAFSAQLVSGYSGAISSEHGDGRSRSWLNERVYGPELYSLFRQVKQAFDPDNLLNPGNIVDMTSGQMPEVLKTADIYAHPMTAHLRYGPDYRPLPVKEHLDFSADQGLLGAIEMCNGAGVCRKLTTGGMCPSFMATRDEEHSTRGRANALRAALSGGLPAEELTSPRMFEVLDLCIECKACRAECPASVDMAKIKSEFLAHYYEHHPIPLRVRLFAHIARWSRLSSGWPAPLVNMLLKADPLRWGLDKFLGISRRRPLPEFAGKPFTVWFKRHRQQLSVGGHASAACTPIGGIGGQPPAVVLFNDTFNTYNTPHVAIAATEVLEAAGFRVTLPGHRCCGRPMISKGLFGPARRAALETVERLYPLAEQGLPIVGLEPSCLLSLRDEYLALLPGDPRVKQVAAQCYTFEEFIAHLADTGQLKLEFVDTVRPVLLHGHCHQKALGGSGPSRQVLSLPPGYTVTEVDSACCGMAGAFGYEVEHYDISLTMGEQRLFPAVRRQPEETIIVAAGVSCRQQIKHGTSRQALHPAEVLRQALRV